MIPVFDYDSVPIKQFARVEHMLSQANTTKYGRLYSPHVSTFWMNDRWDFSNEYDK